MTTIVDTDALLGLVDETDALHTQAAAVAQRLADHNATIFILPTTLAEFATLATIKLGFVTAKQLVDRIVRQGYSPLDMTIDMLYQAHSLYLEQRSKENALFDCFTMVAAKRHNLDCIFSFDRGYTQNGYTLASEYTASLAGVSLPH